MKEKFYAVALKDGETGIFETWDEAKAFVATNPKSARYKRFDTREAAEAFLSGEPADGPKRAASGNPDSRPTAPAGTCVAFVDGSFNAKTNTWGYGVVLYDPNDPTGAVTELSGRGVTHASARNVTGETHAAVKAVETARRLGFEAVDIYYDYQGVESWATGAWSANTEMTENYKRRMGELRRVIDVNFHKVKGHSGVTLNDRADALAKRGCGVV